MNPKLKSITGLEIALNTLSNQNNNIMRKLLNHWRTQLSLLLNPVPEVQSEYVDKVVYLLRRDFKSQEQNEILLAVATKLSSLRDQDMRDLEKEYANLQENTNILKSRLALS